ncbi:MAG: RNA methyltransferase [Dehalococcoidia bacterium]|nr:RNA methyltransferase [Dehalococcoidia bacterium]
MTLALRNPHAVLAAFDARPADILEVRLPDGRAPGAWERVAALARQHDVPLVEGPRAQPRAQPRALPRARDAEGGRAGPEAVLRERAAVSLDALYSGARDAPGAGAGASRLWLALDSIQDPHNVGAIFRTAAFFGVRGIVTTADRAAPLTSVVYDVASGGVEAVPFAIETNLRRALDAAKAAGLWILGSSEHATQGVAEVARDRAWLLVLGNEEEGLRRLTLDTCDEVCRVAPRGEIVTSLNVASAAAVMIAALSR